MYEKYPFRGRIAQDASEVLSSRPHTVNRLNGLLPPLIQAATVRSIGRIFFAF